MHRYMGLHSFWLIMIAALIVLPVPGTYAYTKAICRAATPDLQEETLTVYGRFCDAPRVFFGLTDGTSAKLEVLASDLMSVTAHLPDIWTSSTTHKVIVECGWWRQQRCEINVAFPPPVCGNAIVEVGEECDDGNTDDTDGCTNACEGPICGDNIVSSGEDCDTGGVSTASCDADCTSVACGDGFVNDAAGEECDPPGDTCSDTCQSLVICTTDLDCSPEEFCNASDICTPKLPNGGQCFSPNACTHNFCSDGVCCDMACTGENESCVASETGVEDGMCLPIPP